MALLVLPAMLGACATARPGVPPRASSMTLDAALKRGVPADPTAAELIMASVRVTDADGKALMAPRLLAKFGEPASIRVGTDEHAIEIQVTTRREGAGVRVDAVLTETGVPGRLTATAVAKDETRAP